MQNRGFQARMSEKTLIPKEGCPFGRAKNSARPIGAAHIKDPFSGEDLAEKEILQVVAELLSERKIEDFRTMHGRGLRKA